jgi:hypothetical protein
VPPDVQVVVPQAESNEPLQQLRWTCHPGRILSAVILEHTTEQTGIRRKSAEQQRQERVVPPDVQVVVPQAESHKPPQQIRWTCHPDRILSAAKLEHTSEPPGIRRESASQQHQECVVPPDVQLIVPQAESHKTPQQIRWTCHPGRILSAAIHSRARQGTPRGEVLVRLSPS